MGVWFSECLFAEVWYLKPMFRSRQELERMIFMRRRRGAVGFVFFHVKDDTLRYPDVCVSCQLARKSSSADPADILRILFLVHVPVGRIP